MLSTNARYVYEVYRLKSVSKAAEELYISQPALSAAIRRAEREIGAPIFNRKTLPFTLTPEGKVYLEAVEKMMAMEKETAERVQEICQTKQGLLRIGISTYASFFLIPSALSVFHRKYPKVDVNIKVAGTSALYHALENGVVDAAFLPVDEAPPAMTAVPLAEARLTVALRRDAPEAALLAPWAVTYDELVSRSYGDDRLLTDPSVLQDFEFVYSPAGTDLYKKRKLLFSGVETEPYVLSNSGNFLFNYNLMLAGVGALLTNDLNVATLPANDTCLYVVLDGENTRQQYSFLYPTAVGSAVRDAFVETAVSQFTASQNAQSPADSLTFFRNLL